MERCPSCGARLAPRANWCGQCYASVPVERATDPEPPLWRRAGTRERSPGHAASYSRLRSGPTSFGAFGRGVLTVLLLGGLVIGYPMARGGMLAFVGFDIPGRPFLIAYSVVAGIAGAYLVARIWKRARVA